jgi:hypothetical protein
MPTQTAPRKLVLGKDVLLARFVRHYTDGRYQLARATIQVEGVAIDKKRASAARNILLPPEVHEILAAGFKPLDQLVDSLEQYPIANLRGLTPAQAETFAPRWEAGQHHLAAARDEVRDVWQPIVVDWNEAYWRPIFGDHYPRIIGRRLDDIYRNLDVRYSYDYDLWEPPQPAEAWAASPVVKKWVEEGRANAEKAVEEALLAFVEGPRMALAAAAQEVIDTLTNPQTKVIRAGTFNAMRDAMHRLRALKGISDKQLIDQINQMEDTLDTVVGEAETSSGFTATIRQHAETLTAAIGDVISAARDEGARQDILLSFGGRSGRAVEVD